MGVGIRHGKEGTHRCFSVELGMRLGEYRVERVSADSLPGFLVGIAFGLTEGSYWI